MPSSDLLQENVPLSSLTTLEVGGPTRFLAHPETVGEVRDLLEHARRSSLETAFLGEGSNVLAADEGFEGLIVQVRDRTWEVLEDDGTAVRILAGAGTRWDDLVERTVAEDLAGLECLSGIPGLAGAAPIQNIGAYGQEVAETLAAVRVLERDTGEAVRLAREDCGFGYRTSRFKTDWLGRFAIVGLEVELRRGGAPALRYADLQGRFASGEEPTLAAVREAVLEVRGAKSMLQDPSDPNRRSAGSFFVNPVVPEGDLDRIRAAAPPDRPLQTHPGGPGLVKVPAAWLIEAAGFYKGYALGRAGLSSKHVLALVNRGGATAAELIALAARIRRVVRERFGVTLEPETNFLGFREPAEALLERAGG